MGIVVYSLSWIIMQDLYHQAYLLYPCEDCKEIWFLHVQTPGPRSRDLILRNPLLPTRPLWALSCVVALDEVEAFCGSLSSMH